MAECRLYIRYGRQDTYYGKFPNREKAEAHYQLIKAKVHSQYGTGATPIYVEQGKGSGK